MSIHCNELTDTQCNLIEPFFPKCRTGRPAKYSNRQLFNGSLWAHRTAMDRERLFTHA